MSDPLASCRMQCIIFADFHLAYNSWYFLHSCNCPTCFAIPLGELIQKLKNEGANKKLFSIRILSCYKTGWQTSVPIMEIQITEISCEKL
jgi:hypothetical protein